MKRRSRDGLVLDQDQKSFSQFSEELLQEEVRFKSQITEICEMYISSQYSPAKTGKIREYSLRALQKVLKDNNTISSIWGENMLVYLSLEIICFSIVV